MRGMYTNSWDKTQGLLGEHLDRKQAGRQGKGKEKSGYPSSSLTTMTCQVYWGMGDKGSVLRERHGNPAVVLKIRCSTTNSTMVDTHTKVCLPLLLLQTTVRRRHPEGEV